MRPYRVVFEFTIWGRSAKWMQGKVRTQVLWLTSVLAIGLATLCWALSQTGGRMCDPASFFQPHGLLWLCCSIFTGVKTNKLSRKRGGSSKGERLSEETESGNNAWRKHQFGRYRWKARSRLQ